WFLCMPTRYRMIRRREFVNRQLAGAASPRRKRAPAMPKAGRQLPGITYSAGAAVGDGAAGELAIELGADRESASEAKLGTGRGQRRILRRCRAVDDEARAGQRLEGGNERRIAPPVVGPSEP